MSKLVSTAATIQTTMQSLEIVKGDIKRCYSIARALPIKYFPRPQIEEGESLQHYHAREREHFEKYGETNIREIKSIVEDYYHDNTYYLISSGRNYRLQGQCRTFINLHECLRKTARVLIGGCVEFIEKEFHRSFERICFLVNVDTPAFPVERHIKEIIQETIVVIQDFQKTFERLMLEENREIFFKLSSKTIERLLHDPSYELAKIGIAENRRSWLNDNIMAKLAPVHMEFWEIFWRKKVTGFFEHRLPFELCIKIGEYFSDPEDYRKNIKKREIGKACAIMIRQYNRGDDSLVRLTNTRPVIPYSDLNLPRNPADKEKYIKLILN